VVKGQKSRSLGTKNALSVANTHPGAYEWYALAASNVQQQRAAATDGRISWLRRGDFGALRALARLGGKS